MKKFSLLSFCIIGIWLLTMGSVLAKDKDDKYEALENRIEAIEQLVNSINSSALSDRITHLEATHHSHCGQDAQSITLKLDPKVMGQPVFTICIDDDIPLEQMAAEDLRDSIQSMTLTYGGIPVELTLQVVMLNGDPMMQVYYLIIAADFIKDGVPGFVDARGEVTTDPTGGKLLDIVFHICYAAYAPDSPNIESYQMQVQIHQCEVQ